jgi:GT2 family glycosyltransferase
MNRAEAAAIRPEAACAPAISVIVATCNRAGKLARCLERLLAMDTGRLAWELICVDNNSSDQTRKLVESFARRAAVPLLYVFEGVQGLGAARNAGLRRARGGIIAMTDDDCLVAADWLAAIWREFQGDPALALLGGRAELHNAHDLPLTIRTSRERRSITADSLFDIIPGCNMAFRRGVVERIGGFDADFGAGAPLPAGEDTDFVYRACRAGFAVAYSPAVLLFHDHGRRTGRESDRLRRGYITARGALYLKHALAGDRRILRLAYWEVAGLVKAARQAALSRSGLGQEIAFLAYLALGALSFPLVRLRASLRRSPATPP